MMTTNGSLELLVLRLAVTNSIIDPWIYILLRKETIVGLLRVKTAISGLCFTKKDQPSPKTGAAEETRSKYTAKESRDASTSPEIIVKFTCPHSQGTLICICSIALKIEAATLAVRLHTYVLLNALNLLMQDVAFSIVATNGFVYFLVCGKRMDTKHVASDDEC